MGELINGGVLRRIKKESGTLSKLSDEEIINYVSEKYTGKNFSYLKRNDSSAHRIIIKRGLIDKLVERRILTKVERKSFRNMTDEECINYVFENHRGKNVNSFVRNDKGAYENFRRWYIS